MKKSKFYLPSMHCLSCIKFVKGLINEDLGIKRININLNKKIVSIKYSRKQYSEYYLKNYIESLNSVIFINDPSKISFKF